MNTSLRGQARFPAILLPLNRPFQISIHGIGTVMNKKTSFKFNRTKAGHRDGKWREILCMRSAARPTASNHAKHSHPHQPPPPPARPKINGGGRRMEHGSLTEWALLSAARRRGAGESQSSIPFAIKTVHNRLGSPRQPAN